MQFLGMIVILFVGAAVVRIVFEVLKDPNVINAISVYSPLLAEYSNTLAWVSAAVLFGIVLMIPVRLIMKRPKADRNGLEIVGSYSFVAIQAVAMTFAVLAVGYYAAVGLALLSIN